jgi:hypothetical protein
VANVPIPTSVVYDGTVDVTATLQSILNSSSANDVIRFQPFGLYRVDGTLTIPHTLDIRGAGALIFRFDASAGPAARHITATTIDGLHIRNLGIKGNAGGTLNYPRGPIGYDPNRETQHGIELLGCTNVTLDRVRIRNVWGDKIYCGLNGSNAKCDTVTATGCGGLWSHRHSVTLTGCDNWSSTGNDWGESWRSGVNLEPNSSSGGGSNITFDGDSWGYHHLLWVTSNAAAGTVSNVTFRDCHCDGGALTLNCGGAMTHANWTIDSCSGTQKQGDPSGGVMDFDTVATVTVTDNLNPLQDNRDPAMRIARFTNCTTVTYTGNTPDLG